MALKGIMPVLMEEAGIVISSEILEIWKDNVKSVESFIRLDGDNKVVITVEYILYIEDREKLKTIIIGKEE